MTVTVSAAAGPFTVTSPNTNINVFAGGNFNVTWNVANTTAAPISVANVKISLSVDGGQTFPHVLAASTGNDGSESVAIPSLPASTTARVKIESIGNIFFDMSNTNFSLVGALLAKNADFDGDGKADLSVYRSGTWHIKNSGNGAHVTTPFGLTTDKLVPGDYDGDNKTDYAVYRNGIWYALQSTAGIASQSWGTTGDIPVAGDYDGDAKTDFAVYRPSTGVWYVLRSSNATALVQSFGSTGDIPVRGDFDNDAKTDFAVFRPSTGVWHLLRSTLGATSQSFGLAGDTLVPADYDGDGRADLAVARPSGGGVFTWYIQRSTAGLISLTWGLSTDRPSPADYDGDGKADISVFRATVGSWTTQRSLTGTLDIQTFGTAGDVSVPGSYIPE